MWTCEHYDKMGVGSANWAWKWLQPGLQQNINEEKSKQRRVMIDGLENGYLSLKTFELHTNNHDGQTTLAHYLEMGIPAAPPWFTPTKKFCERNLQGYVIKLMLKSKRMWTFFKMCKRDQEKLGSGIRWRERKMRNIHILWIEINQKINFKHNTCFIITREPVQTCNS